jgi:vacuolar-type H+-ATPase subunit I/STV1
VNQESSGPDQDWVSQAIGTLESAVDAIRSKTTAPLLKLVQAVVFGFMGLGIGVMALFLLTIFFVRFADAYLPYGVWLAYLLIGACFTSAGLFLWSKRHNPQS